MKASGTKILFFVTEDWFVCSHWLPLIIGARGDGYDLVVVTRTNQHAEIIRRHGARVIPFELSRRGSNLFREIAAIWRLLGIYREEKPDIVHHVAMKPMLYGSLVARLLRIPHTFNWVAGMGWLFVSDMRQAKLLQAVVRRVLGILLRGTMVIVENRDDREIIAGLGVRPGISGWFAAPGWIQRCMPRLRSPMKSRWSCCRRVCSGTRASENSSKPRDN